MLRRLLQNGRLFILAGVGLALVVGVLMFRLLSQQAQVQPTNVAAVSPSAPVQTGAAQPASGAPAAAPPAPVSAPYTIVAASTDLYTPTALNSAVVITTYFYAMPSATKPTTAEFASLADFMTYVGITNTYTARTIMANQPVVKNMLKPMGDRTMVGLSLRIPASRVAESVSLASLSSVNNAIVPGDQVDVLASIPSNLVYNFAPPQRPASTSPAPIWDKSWPTQTQTVLQNVGILAVTPVVNGPTVYTLLLGHQDALIIKYLKDVSANFELVLRSSADQSAQAFTTSPVLPDYLAQKLHTPFTHLNPPFTVPTGQ